MEKFIVDHIDWIFYVVGSFGAVALWLIKRWMNKREEKEGQIENDIKEVKESMALIERNYLDRFKEITKNQTDMKAELMAEFNSFKIDMTSQNTLISQKLDAKHDPLRESIEKLLKKFDK